MLRDTYRKRIRMTDMNRSGLRGETLGYPTSLAEVTSPTVVAPPLPNSSEKFVTDDDGHTIGKIINLAPVTPSEQACLYCQKSDRPEDLYRPCRCASYIHRDCFQSWRVALGNPSHYYACPHCFYTYTIERVRPASDQTRMQMKRQYRQKLITMWLTVVLAYVSCVGILAGITYECDTEHKHIPVATRYLTSSVVNGFPDSNSTHLWEETFKQPDVRVWPYYTMFGVFLTSILIITGFMSISHRDDAPRRRSTRNSTCCDDCCRGPYRGSNTTVYIGGNNDCDCCCRGHHNCCSGGDCGGSSGNCNNSDCGKDLGALIAVVAIVIIVVAIFSALYVTLAYAIKQAAQLYAEYTDMIISQVSEVVGESIVLGIDEQWRPSDSL